VGAGSLVGPVTGFEAATATLEVDGVPMLARIASSFAIALSIAVILAIVFKETGLLV
jgi:hypothetical protein